MCAFLGAFKKNNTNSDAAAVPEAKPVSDTDALEEMKQRVHLASARMKPHYIGNVLSALYYLCDVDTESAQEMVLALSGYLRQNVEAINREELLPFSWELEHVQNYLTLENLRFEGKINALYDIAVEDFELPPLTLQPFFENAVKLGIAPLEGPGTVTLSTRRLVDGSVQIKITDNGVGFDTAILNSPGDKPRSIDCVKDRLKRELNGEVTVESTPGRGTTVTVTIPPRS